MRNIIPSFTSDEIDKILKKSNLTQRELELLHLRNKELSLECCADEMHLSTRTIGRINKQLINKITRTFS